MGQEVMGVSKRLWPLTTLWPWLGPLQGAGIIPPKGPQLFCSRLPKG